ncbi:MAG: hypothetical protein ABMA64_17315, partial [Myxococcota bacterium]
MRDLYHQDVVEMVERETRQFQMWEIVDPDDPTFRAAYDALWSEFGPWGEMEREDAIRQYMRDDPFDPTPSGTFVRYFLLAARNAHGELLGVRDGSVLVNPGYDDDLCVVYLSHIYMFPAARGTVLSYWLRIAPVELAVEYLAELHAKGKIELPLPEQPAKYFGMRVDLAAEMEYFSPDDRISWQRILFYGRGGFDAINPRHFPYLQPDFREPEEIRRTGNNPVPFMILVRRMGREREATMPIDEASGLMRLLYDDFACHCAPEFLENSLQLVLDRLAERSQRKSFVELLPLPTGAKDLGRLKRLYRYTVYQRHYDRSLTEVRGYLETVRGRLRTEPRWLETELDRIGAELEQRVRYVYPNRERDWRLDDRYTSGSEP